MPCVSPILSIVDRSVSSRGISDSEGTPVSATVRLGTNSVLTEALTMYESARSHPKERYNNNPFAKRWSEKGLAISGIEA